MDDNTGGKIMWTVQDIANWFLSNSSNITNKKLQKLVYYAYSWFLVLNNESADTLGLRLFPNKFEAWVHGAVYPELYFKYRSRGSGWIPSFNGELVQFSDDEIDILNQVLEVYGDYTGNQLESICHQESPWQKARVGLQAYDPSRNPIDDVDIFECYSERL